jgi:alpha-glucosidase
MQWNDTANAGFSERNPWLPVPDSYKTHNVATELKEPNSVLQFYKHALALRHQNRALLDGEYIALNEDDPNVLSYLRKYKDEAVLVVLNMSSEPHKASFDLGPQGFRSTKVTTLLTSAGSETAPDISQLSLQPFAVYIAEVSEVGAAGK